MNKVRHLCLAALLTLTCAPSASAGEIECGVTNPPPPPTQQRATADEPTVTTGETGGEVVAAIATILQSVLSVF